MNQNNQNDCQIYKSEKKPISVQEKENQQISVLEKESLQNSVQEKDNQRLSSQFDIPDSELQISSSSQLQLQNSMVFRVDQQEQQAENVYFQDSGSSYGYNLYKKQSQIHGQDRINYLIAFNIFAGGWIMIIIGIQYIFRQYLEVDPGNMAICFSIIVMPQPIKFTYGIMSDNIPIMGYRRKPYIFFFGICNCLCFLLLFSQIFKYNMVTITVIVTIANTCYSWMSTVTDAMTCQMSKQDKEFGSQKLFSICQAAYGTGGIIGGIIGGGFTQFNHPKYIFLIYSLLGLLVASMGILLDEEKMKENEQQVIQQNQMRRRDSSRDQLIYHNSQNNKPSILGELWDAVTRKEIFLIIMFFLCDCVCSPDFSQYQYIFMLDITQINQAEYSFILTLKQLFLVIGSVMYQKYFQSVEPRNIIFVTCFFYVIYTFMNFAFAERLNTQIGIPDFLYIILQEGVVLSIADTLLSINLSAFFAKMVPDRIEATVYAFYSGTYKLTYFIISPLMGVFLNDYLINPPIGTKNINQFYKLTVIQILIQPLGFLTMQLIPSRESVEIWIQERNKNIFVKDSEIYTCETESSTATADGNSDEKKLKKFNNDNEEEQKMLL